MGYATVKFEVAMSNGLGGDTRNVTDGRRTDLVKKKVGITMYSQCICMQ